jgi:hypothetical protein
MLFTSFAQKYPMKDINKTKSKTMIDTKPKIKRNKIYNFRVSDEELKIIRELAREYNLPGMFRLWIKEIYNELHRDPDDTTYGL